MILSKTPWLKTPGCFVFKGDMKENNNENQQRQVNEHELTAEELVQLIEAKIERARRMQQSFRQSHLETAV